VQIGTRLLGSAGPPGEHAPAPDGSTLPRGADGTLLALIPIPGTGTSLAIVGYPVPGPGATTGPPDRLGATAPADRRTGLLLDHEQRRVLVDGREVTLTFQEFELLAFLSAHPATVFTRAELATRVWQRDFPADSRTVDVHISRLRHKLGRAYARCLVTEYRVGYQFRPDSGVSAADRGARLSDGDAQQHPLL
jgi:DNA-binding winged helix-turn-helix (wHTH) protein